MAFGGMDAPDGIFSFADDRCQPHDTSTDNDEPDDNRPTEVKENSGATTTTSD